MGAGAVFMRGDRVRHLVKGRKVSHCVASVASTYMTMIAMLLETGIYRFETISNDR